VPQRGAALLIPDTDDDATTWTAASIPTPALDPTSPDTPDFLHPTRAYLRFVRNALGIVGVPQRADRLVVVVVSGPKSCDLSKGAERAGSIKGGNSGSVASDKLCFVGIGMPIGLLETRDGGMVAQRSKADA